MQIIVSSKVLKEALNALPGRVDSIISSGHGEIRKVKFCSDEYFARIECVTKDALPFIEQSNRRWDWVKDLMNQVNEQPITLDITEQQVRIIFHY